MNKSIKNYQSNPTDETWFLWTVGSYNWLLPNISYETANNLLDLFVLYMFHQFSIFEGFVYDPITKMNVPVLSMFMTAKTMEKGMKDRVLSDRQCAQIKQLLDYE